jgi:hypothetical protein
MAQSRNIVVPVPQNKCSLAVAGRRRRYRHESSGLSSSLCTAASSPLLQVDQIARGSSRVQGGKVPRLWRIMPILIVSPSVVLLWMTSTLCCQAFVLPSLPSKTTPILDGTHTPSFGLCAKRKDKNRRGDDDDSMNSWYDDVDSNATPGGVFWEEMERQRLFNQLGGETNTAGTTSSSPEMAAAAFSSMAGSTSNSNSNSFAGGGGASMPTSTATMASSMPDSAGAPRKPPSMEELKSAESTLSQYTTFQVSDNWLDEDKQAYFQQLESMEEEEELTLDEETRRLEDQLEALPDGYGRNRASIWDISDSEEPWDFFGDDDSKTVDPDRANTLIVAEPSPGKYIRK